MSEPNPTSVRLARCRINGEVLYEVDAEPTATAGVFVYQERDDCSACEDEYGIAPPLDDCKHPAEYSWLLICQAGILLSTFCFEEQSARDYAAQLSSSGMDFTLPLNEVLTQARETDAGRRAEKILRAPWRPSLATAPS